jgi:Domain of unknown function (DUF6438)
VRLAYVLLVATGCAGPVIASLQRSVCFGWCPVYTVEVHANGRVDYHGEAHVKHHGYATGWIGREQIAQLRRAFETAGYRALETAYVTPVATDVPTVTISYDGKTIVHEHGFTIEDGVAPHALYDLEDQVDAIVDIEQWIGSDGDRRSY